ncbi:hypothetical protein CLAFUW4_12591 [Fulvia fulva]|uniref:Uncharacterized protein n=1 Tax=Passalora fulva TaxID=5499 RepID=A0A9Q8PEV9_PASFU|nr:uncharacterized protein CLAFUR5_11616 [Fulvia fulva]KAK4617706.1 hypothetical protein CLAFUR4_12596 [Fulvia fulva]KAK4618490.1 hypothetical protein CLAFUR0_12607 [Fulvia fulva]UJO21137.1 hypothetical protein CLAFUR5_11616 [Fulvia fulva]WPV18144.1 hypothetical protein CLAFUW4_12591 [Fulvia fulva]WPV33319.1 hypothetical protein CLAFUW7_12598 [Fulvia fulva]
MPAWCAIKDVTGLRKYINADKEQYLGMEPASVFSGHPFARVLLAIAPDLKGFSEKLRFRARCLDTGLVAATTLYMDIYDVLGGDLERGIREIMPYMERLETTLKDWKDYNDPAHERNPLLSDHAIDEGPLKYDSLREQFLPVRNTSTTTGWRANKHVTRDDIARDPSCWKKDDWPGAFISSNVLCSLPIFATQAVNLTLHDVQCHGLNLCNNMDLVLAAAHWYNAAKISGTAPQSWPDMDFVIERENEVSRYLGTGDGTVCGAAKQFCLALGMTLPQVTGKSRVAIPHIGKNKSAKMSNISRFTPHDSGLRSMHTARHRHEKVAWTTLAHKNGLDLSRLYSVIKGYASSVGIRDPVLSGQWRATRRLSPSQLLKIIEEIFVEDEAYIHFDLHQFYMRCFSFMYEVLKHHREFISEKRAMAYSRRQMSFPFMVNEILWDAVALEGSKHGMKNTMLYHVGQILNAMQPSNLSVATTQAQRFSSRRIPEHLKPATLYSDTAVMAPSALQPSSLVVHEVELDEYKRLRGTYTVNMTDTRDWGDPGQINEDDGFAVREDEDGITVDNLRPNADCPCCHGKDGIRLFTLERIQCMQQVLREHRASGNMLDAQTA